MPYDKQKYYQNFKDKHGEKLTEKIICDVCGGSYSYYNKSHHIKTKKHQKKINKNE